MVNGLLSETFAIVFPDAFFIGFWTFACSGFRFPIFTYFSVRKLSFEGKKIKIQQNLVTVDAEPSWVTLERTYL